MGSYQFEYYDESLSCAFDEAGVYDNYAKLSIEQRNGIVSTILTSIECQSMAFGYVDTRGAEDPEITRLKARLKEAERDTERWQEAFKKNVASRRNWDKNEIIIEEDGGAYIRR